MLGRGGGMAGAGLVAGRRAKRPERPDVEFDIDGLRRGTKGRGSQVESGRFANIWQSVIGGTG